MSASGSLETVSERLLQTLGERPWKDDFYLAGSAALSLHLSHRPVRDLDLMTRHNRLASRERRALLEDFLRFDSAMMVETARDGYLSARTGEGIGLKLFYYPYPRLAADDERLAGNPGSLVVASLLDLGLMKIAAIISRGSLRDFLDLYGLCQRLPLEELLARSPEKFSRVRDFPLQALKGLADWSVARDQPLPAWHRQPDLAVVESWFRDQVRTLGRRHVGWTGC
ncbi:MAG: nucleotidyl transferase AbiEii/AbiGii toxin family protein [Acidobacteriota bacterium]